MHEFSLKKIQIQAPVLNLIYNSESCHQRIVRAFHSKTLISLYSLKLLREVGQELIPEGHQQAFSLADDPPLPNMYALCH